LPASRLSFFLTDAYRDSLQGYQRSLQALTRSAWNRINPDDLDGTYPLPFLTAAVSSAQTRATQTSAAYLTAFLTSETGEPQPPLALAPRVGQSRDGRPLREALTSPLIAIKAAYKDGRLNPMNIGLQRAVRMVGLELDHAARTPLLLTLDQDERFDGWQRAVRGTCGACLGSATGPDGGLMFERHPNCQCVSEPRVSGVRDRYPRPTGAIIFAAMDDADQDAALGPQAAEAVRNGLPLDTLVATSRQRTTQDFITQGATPATA